MNSSGDLLSHTVASAVPSALLSLTAGAGNVIAEKLNDIGNAGEYTIIATFKPAPKSAYDLG